MVKFGLKLWSNNIELFDDALRAHADGSFDFIELYCNPEVAFDWPALTKLKGIPVMIHAPAHTEAFHDLIIGTQEKRIWKDVIALADFFDSSRIVLHPGREHTIASLKEELNKIDDPRIVIENMAGLDIFSRPMFGQRMSDLLEISKIRPICFDFEKAVKAACYQRIAYKDYITEALEKLDPAYFHISGGNSDSPVDQHMDLQASDIDFSWIKRQLESRDADIVFETPKKDALANDLKNMDFFSSL